MTDDNTRDSVVVYHNPVCSNTRGALEILGERGVDAEVIEYV
jgi:arsenate reductase